MADYFGAQLMSRGSSTTAAPPLTNNNNSVEQTISEVCSLGNEWNITPID